ncbi:YegP family protein [Microbacterium sp. NPDC091662]|uniref:YegP family protein n=1 Tax=Microbacterium sp. NPDC091662 TaxID=3364211 RepID=UPI003825EBDB
MASSFNIYKTLGKTQVNTQYYWTLEAENGEVIATSEMYQSKAGAQNGIAAVKRVAPGARILDVSLYQ